MPETPVRTSQSEYKVKDPPSDGITAVKFQPGSSQFLLVSSWDCSLRLYDLNSRQIRTHFNHEEPVLDCCFSDPVRVFSGGLDHAVKGVDSNSGQELFRGYHDEPVRCVHFSHDINAVITGSWDSTVKLWDPRCSDGRTMVAISTHTQPQRVYTMDTVGHTLVVGTAQRRVVIWDLRNMSYHQQERESSLKYQTRCLRCFPNGQGFALSSIEGRVAVEFFDPSPEVQKQKYAFKCHRVKEGDTEEIHPVNAIAFHKVYNTFATGGSDGMVNIWDGFNRKRLVQLHRFPTSIASIAFSDDGFTLAIASSYMFERGDDFKPADDEIYIRTTTDQEVKPKALPASVAGAATGAAAGSAGATAAPRPSSPSRL